jgi:hypothetical protein
MGINMRARRDVLRDKEGVASSLADAIGGVSLKLITVSIVGGLLATVLTFWVINGASADTSSGFQTSSLGFEKAVQASNVVVGINDKRVGLLTDMPSNKCEVATWQTGTREGETTLVVDTKTVAGVCTPTTALLAVGAGDTSQELLFNIDAPKFAFSNLGGRKIVFSSTGTPTLVTGAKPADVKAADWNDVRPYKATLELATLNEDTAAVAKKAVLSAFTNVINVTAADDDLRYVPSPSDAPIPGPVRITGVARSTTTGVAYAGAREGAAVTFAGAVCPSGPTKVIVSYTQQGPSAAPAVNSVLNAVLTGADTTVHLAAVPNGSSGAVEVAATCVDGGVVEKTTLGYTQTVPATVLTVKQNAAPEKHDLTWIPVSSLPTTFELRWTVGAKNNALLTTTSALAYQSVNAVGGNLGLTSTYTIVATVDSNDSPVATASITNPFPQAPATIVTSNVGGATWAAIACTTGATPQYASRYYQQTGTDATVTWTALTGWSTARSLTGVTTPGYGRTVAQVHTRCVANVSGEVSPANDNFDVFYAPEAIQIAAGRSAVAGTEYMGAREGMIAWHAGARCYNNSASKIDLTWQPTTPAGQSPVTSSRVLVPKGTVGESVDLANVYNGAQGNLVGTASCTAGKTSTSTLSTAFSQTLPNPGLTVTQTTPEAHRLDWNRVSTLPTTFSVEWKSTNGTGGVAGSTTALTYTKTYAAGTTYGMNSDYSVRPVVGNLTSSSYVGTSTPWPAPPIANSITYTHTAAGAYTNGNITWNNGAACPAGTTARSRQVANAAGLSNGTVDWREQAASAFTNNKTGEGNLIAMLQGYTYAVRVDTQCYSPVTGSASAVGNAQSAFFVTPMAQPAGAIWDAWNYRENIRGTQWTYHTSPGVGSIRVDWRTFCSPGSWMGWSNWTSTSWTGSRFNHAIGYSDDWQLPAGWTTGGITYGLAEYSCNTPWVVSARSPISGSLPVTVTR